MEDAGIFWEILAGQGTWGALLFAVVGLLWRFTKPYLDQWVALKKLETLYGFAKTAAANVKQKYVDEIKKASEDGRLTDEEKDIALNKAKDIFIDLAKTQGIDVVKEYSMNFVEWLIENFVGDSKEMAAIAPFSALSWVPTPQTDQEAQQPPLPDLQQQPRFVPLQDVPGVTGADFGSKTNPQG